MLVVQSVLGPPNPQWKDTTYHAAAWVLPSLQGPSWADSVVPLAGLALPPPRSASWQVLPEKPLEADLPAANFLFQNNGGQGLPPPRVPQCPAGHSQTWPTL